MTTPELIVQDYLQHLQAAAAGLPVDRQEELLDGIREHLAGASASGALRDEVSTRSLLERLGQPAEIVAAARLELPGEQASGVLVRRGTGLELAAVLMLTVGSLLPVVGWVVGVVLLCLSRRWRRWEKLLGVLVVPFGPGGLFLLGHFVSTETISSSCGGATRINDDGSLTELSQDCVTTTSGFRVGPYLLLAVLLASSVVAVLLYRRASRRATLEPLVWQSAVPTSPWGALEVAGVLVLGLGGFLVPVVGPLVGLVLVCSSPRWARGQKATAAAVLVVPVLLALAGLAGSTFGLPPGLSVGVLPLLLLLPATGGLAAVLLTVWLNRRRPVTG